MRIAVVHRPHRGDWSLPKGKLDVDEPWAVAAGREVREETGLAVALGPPLPTQHYEVEGAPKEVRYWSATLADPRVDSAGVAFVPNAEVDALEWLTMDGARARLTHGTDHAVLAGFVELFAPEDFQRPDVLVLLRHARAMKRAVWRGPDDERPLDERGLAQAERLVALLGAYGIDEVHSSNTRRCLDTVEPYAAAHQLSVAHEPRTSEKGHRHKPQGAARRLAELLDLGGRLVLCSHRPVLPALLAQVVGPASGAALIGDGLPPAAMVVVHHRTGAVLEVERIDP